jgi:outer membrane protein assembly factor BamB
VAGTAIGPIALDKGTRFRNDGAEHAFLMKLDARGSVVWVRRLGSKPHSGERGLPRGVTTLAVDGNTVVMAGAFDWQLPGGRQTSGTLARLSGDGSLRWIRKDNELARIGEADPSRAMGIVVAADGIVVTGCTRTWEIPRLRGVEAGESRRQGFVVSFSPAGEQRWNHALQASTGNSGPGVLHPDRQEEPGACGTAVAVGPAHDIFAAGTFHRLPGKVTGVGMPQQGSFLARLSPEGQVRWSQVISRYPTSPRLAALPGGKVVVAGALEATTNATAGLVAYDPAGTRLWQLQARAITGGFDSMGAFVASRDGAIFWAGRLQGKTTIGPFVLEGPEDSEGCAFVARCRVDGTLVFVTPVRGGATCSPTAMAVGRTLWLAGRWFGARDSGTYVHTMRLPEHER